MNRVGWIILLVAPLVNRAAPILAADAAAPAVEMRVPQGFTVELVAAAPLVEHPIMAGFDDQGRLFVADNAGLNLPADELLKQVPNMIRMLEDTDGDGRFDRSTVFADKMTFPQGAAWYRGALYVASPPSIWRLEDTDGDGVADRREEIVHKFGFIGNAADIHGCFVTPTGRIAWCDGRHGHEFKDATGQTSSQGLAARVFTCRPDGSNVEVFCGGGMDNPVEVAFTAEGDMIGTMTFYNPDAARHDALVHFVHGGCYPKKHPCTSEFKRTGELMPAISRFGVTAPSGLARQASAEWGEEYRDNLFSAQFNTHKVLRHVLTRQGATYRAVDEDFLVSTSIDFHPTDVVPDADGSLLVIDTGGWFRIGCPTSQIAKPDVGGGIYRIRRASAARPADPRGLTIDWKTRTADQVCDLLEDPRPAVAERAIEWLAQRGDAVTGPLVTTLFESSDYRARQNAVWVLARIGSENARMLLRQALGDDDAPVRQAALKSIADLRDAASIAQLIDVLAHDEPALRREAATGLGRIGKASAVPVLLAALTEAADRFVEHAVIYALIEINDPAATRAGLASSNANVRRGALIALDQMDSQGLSREAIAGLLATDDLPLLRTLVDVLARHPEWADELTGTLRGWLAEPQPSPERLATIRGGVVALIEREDVQALVAGALRSASTDVQTKLMLLEVAGAGLVDTLPASWIEGIRQNLSSADVELARAAIAAAAIDAAPVADRLIAIGLDASRPMELRVAALVTASRAKTRMPPEAFALLVNQLTDDVGVRDRLAAAEALGRFELNAAQRGQVARLIRHCGPLEIGWLLRPFEGDTTAATGLVLVESLAAAPAVSSVPVESLRAVFEHYPSDVQAVAEQLFARQSPGESDRAIRLNALAASMDGGDAAKGEDVFLGARAACAACHRIGSRGERIGPDLSKIGEVRSRRDLVEAIVFPSASLARGFESFRAVTNQGKVHGGLVVRETASAIYLRTADRAEIRVPRDEIEELAPSTISIMPEGLDKVLSTAELADLVAYLQTLK